MTADRWKLVNRITGKIYHDNLSHEKGSELLLSKSESLENKVLVPVSYKFASESTMGKVWA